MMCNSSCAGLQPQRGHSSSDHIDAAVSSWVVSELRTEAQLAQVEFTGFS